MLTNPFARTRLKSILAGGPNQPDSDPFAQPVGTPPFVDPQQNRIQPQQSLEDVDEAPKPQDDTQQYLDEMEKVRGNMPITSQYRQVLAHSPDRKDFKPSVGRRIGASLAGFGTGYTQGATAGAKAAENVVDAPYRNAVSDYSLKAETLGRGSQLEEQEANSKLSAMEAARKMGLSYAEYRQKVAHENRGDNAADEANRIRNHTAMKKNYDPQQMMSGVRMVNREDPHDYYDLPGETVASVNAKTQQSNAKTNAGRLEEEIADHKNKTALASRSLDNQESRTRLLQKGFKVQDQQRARDLVADEMAKDPNYSEFFKETRDGSGIYDVGDDVDQEQFDILQQIMDARVEAKLTKGEGR